MTRRMLLLWCLLLPAASVLHTQESRDWAIRTFTGTPDDVFSAARATLQAQHHHIRSADASKHLLRFRIKDSDLVMVIVPGVQSGQTMAQIDSDISGSAASFPRRARDVSKILDEVEQRLQSESR